MDIENVQVVNVNVDQDARTSSSDVQFLYMPSLMIQVTSESRGAFPTRA